VHQFGIIKKCFDSNAVVSNTLQIRVKGVAVVVVVVAPVLPSFLVYVRLLLQLFLIPDKYSTQTYYCSLKVRRLVFRPAILFFLASSNCVPSA
jgi:hypothetical protein